MTDNKTYNRGLIIGVAVGATAVWIADAIEITTGNPFLAGIAGAVGGLLLLSFLEKILERL